MRNLQCTLAGTVATFVCAGWLQAQIYQPQGGNALDANQQVGSGGVNPVARSYDFTAGNRIVSGTVSGGRAFQGYSPIRDSNQLFLGNRSYNAGTTFGSSTYSSRLGTGGALPSAGLSGFQGSSYSVADQQTGTLTWQNRGVPVGSQATPYYSPANSVANTGAIIAGANRPGTSQLMNPYAAPTGGGSAAATGSARTGTGSSLGQISRLVRAETGAAVNGQVNSQLLYSSLFSSAFRVATPVDLARAAQSDPLIARQVQLPPAPRAMVGSIAADRLPVDLRSGQYQPGDNRIDMRVNPSATEGEPAAAADSNTLLRSGLGTSDAPTGRGIGVFGDMQRIAAGSQSESFETPLVDPSLKPAHTPVTIQSPDEPAPSPLPGQVLRTFVGSEASVTNRYLSSAEDALRKGEYYHAGTLYKMASSIDPVNPLPYLGRSLSLLAAGDYVTSANDLFAAVQLFDSLGLFKLDLKSFLPDLKVLDSRRADMETRLASSEDYRLRFLLGYAEYISGLTDDGVSNMQKAVAAAPMVLGYMHVPSENPQMATSPQVAMQQERVERLQKEFEENRAQWGRRDRHEKKAAREELARAEEEAKALAKALGGEQVSPFANLQMVRIEPVRRFVAVLEKQAKGGSLTPGPITPPAPKR